MAKSKTDPRREGIIPAPIPAPCHACVGHCCTSGFGWTGLPLRDDEVDMFPKNDTTPHWDLAEGGTIHHYHFPKSAKTSCIHFQNGKCKIYDKRPKACKDFDCVEYYVNDSNRLFKYMNTDTLQFMKALLVKHVGV